MNDKRYQEIDNDLDECKYIKFEQITDDRTEDREYGIISYYIDPSIATKYELLELLKLDYEPFETWAREEIYRYIDIDDINVMYIYEDNLYLRVDVSYNINLKE